MASGLPTLKLIGDGAEDYVGHGLVLMRRVANGQQKTFQVDNTTIMCEASDHGAKTVTIIRPAQYAIVFTGGFSFYGPVPDSFPLTPDTVFTGTSPALPDIVGEGYIQPDYQGLSFYNLTDNSMKSRLVFLVPFTSTGFVDNLEYVQQMGPNVTAVAVFDGSSNTSIKFNGGGNEITVTVPNSFQLGAYLATRGHYPCLFDDDMMMFYLQDGARSGTLYNVADDTTLTAVEVPTLPLGAATLQPSWGGYLRESYFYHAISSPDSLHVYMVKSYIPVYGVSSNDYYISNPVKIASTVAVTVEQRLKSDMSIVNTFNLTSSTSWLYSGNPHNWYYIIDGINHSIGCPELVYFNCTGGTVLVSGGVEYPILTGNIIIQGNDGTNDINNAEPIVLWLGGNPDVNSLACPGFDAVALQVSAQDPSVTSSALPWVADGGCRIDCIGDSDSAMLQLFGSSSTTYPTYTPVVTIGPLVQAKVSGGVPILTQVSDAGSYGLYNS